MGFWMVRSSPTGIPQQAWDKNGYWKVFHDDDSGIRYEAFYKGKPINALIKYCKDWDITDYKEVCIRNIGIEDLTNEIP